MTNARQELLDLTTRLGLAVEAVSIRFGYYDEEDDTNEDYVKVILKQNYNDIDYKEFISKLEFTYDSGYGCQELFGRIWFKDGSWATRGEYDGSEWWEHHTRPEIEY
tara:strand:- start:6714 stop:7034 length:321 start_codon:yes stop_codon:yes gene_type:complete